MQEMPDEQNFRAAYGPPAKDPPHKVGETLFYHEGDQVENGEILYVSNDPKGGGLIYVVSPAIATFPTPVWESQVIAGMP